MRIILAESVLDLNTSSPYWVDDRASLCAATLTYFDAVGGLLNFNTTCAGSGNTWTQAVLFTDWDNFVKIRVPDEWGPLYPETDEEKAERERLEEETTIIGNEDWPTVKAKFPELINADVKVSCNCPAYLWWGSKYNLEQRDTDMHPEGVPFPHIRDPENQNIICKHLAAVFNQHF